jgi:hypothetical protein
LPGAFRSSGGRSHRGRLGPGKPIADILRASLAFNSGVAHVPSELFEATGFKPVVEAARIETRGAAK